jgi:hypothetical protein
LNVGKKHVVIKIEMTKLLLKDAEYIAANEKILRDFAEQSAQISKRRRVQFIETATSK